MTVQYLENVMMRLTYFLTLLVFASFVSCSSAQIKNPLQKAQELFGETPLTEAEVARGLKEALVNGITNGSNKASQKDGYFLNPKIKIPFPEDARRVETKLRQIGLGKEVDKFILSLNRGAEKAAVEAKPIFVNAITSLTVEDAWGILKGDNDAATQYLKRTTSSQLTAKFQPIIKSALDEVNATKYYGDLVNTYNKIPFVQKANPDLDAYATQKAIDGLFSLIAEEEDKIREDPLARTTALLQKVFGQAD